MKKSKLAACAEHIIKHDPTFVTFMNILEDHTNLAISPDRYDRWTKLCSDYYHIKPHNFYKAYDIILKCIGNYTKLYNIKIKNSSIEYEGGGLKTNPLYVIIISGERHRNEI